MVYGIKKMKITMVCFVLLYICSCHDNYSNSITNKSKETNRSEEVLKIMRADSLDMIEPDDFYWYSAEQKEKLLSEVRKMKEDYYYKNDHNFPLTIAGPDWEIKGPLTVAEAEQELFDEIISLLGVPQIPIDYVNDPWDKFISQYEEGDELYFYRSDANSWGDLNGEEGYVIIRDNKVAAMKVTAMN